MQDTTPLTGGFDTPATDSAHAFRVVMEAMARPGTIHRLAGGEGPTPLSPAAATLILTLCDGTTPVYLGAAHDIDAIRGWIAFHTGAPVCGSVTGRAQAQFAFGTWADLAPPADFALGTPEYPDRSVTLIVEMDALDNAGATLRGPGIRDTAQLTVPDPAVLRANHARFPLGFDCYFTAGDRIAGLPRSTEIT